MLQVVLGLIPFEIKFMHSANLSVNSGLTCLCWEIKPTL